MKFKKYFKEFDATAKYNRNNAIVYPALGLAGETGEVVDIIKKIVRNQEIRPELFISADQHDALELELGDVLWYWCALVKDLGYDPEDVMQANIDKLKARHA